MLAWHITSGGVVTEIEVHDDERILSRISTEFFGDALLGLTKVIYLDKLRHMAIDDQGHAKELPLNEIATVAYLAACKPDTEWSIAGDAVIFEGILR